MFIEEHMNDYDVTRICNILQVSRSSFYFYCKHNVPQRTIDDKKLKELIMKLWIDNYKRYGAPKIHKVLDKYHNIHISLKKVQRLMKSMNIKSIIIKSYKPKRSKPDEGDFVNILKRDFTAYGINEKWVSDITYVWTDEFGWCYLATILDLYSKRLIGWKFGKRMTAELVEEALENALSTRGLNKVLVLHSDRGKQYTAEIYRSYCNSVELIQMSYSAKGCPYDNAPMESFNSIIKKELVNHTHYETFEQAYLSIFTFIEKWYNRERIHGSIRNMTPLEFETSIQI